MINLQLNINNTFDMHFLALTLEPPGFALYLKQPTGKIYPQLECTDFQDSMLNNNVL